MKKLLRFELTSIIAVTSTVTVCILIWIIMMGQVYVYKSNTIENFSSIQRQILKDGSYRVNKSFYETLDKGLNQQYAEENAVLNVIKPLPISEGSYVFFYNKKYVIFEQNDTNTIIEKNKLPESMFDEWSYGGVNHLKGISESIKTGKSGRDWFEKDGQKFWATWEFFDYNESSYVIGAVTSEQFILHKSGNSDFERSFYIVLILFSILIIGIILVMGFMYVNYNVKIEKLKIDKGNKQERLVEAGKLLGDEQSRVRNLSIIDSLTGVYNRRFFDEMLIKIDLEQFLPIALVLIDVNGLKQYNDKIGREAGDEILITLATLLKTFVGKSDILARVGDDEFAFIMVNTEKEILNEKIEKVQKLVSGINVGNVQLRLSISKEVKYDMAIPLSEHFKTTEYSMNMQNLYNPTSGKGVIVSSLMKTLEERTHETQEHCMRMRRYCTMTGKAIGLRNFENIELGLAAMLHDIGKIAVSDVLLNKDGPYTENQYDDMKEHPEIGYRIAMTSPELSHIARFILEHHERWDGLGYPKGLKGEEISLIARILAVSDSFDAMTSNRPYQRYKSFNDAFEELRRGKGTQFDPFVVEIFIKEISKDILG